MDAPVFHSQAGQDRFVFALLVQPTDKRDGTFLDIGANHPITLSNTYALEQLGRRGLLVDRDLHCRELCEATRKSPFLFVDAALVAWRRVLSDHGLGPAIDYLSLDCDENTIPVVCNFPWSDLRFSVITIEHDAYRFGDGPRNQQREILSKHGYDRLCADVHSEGCCFEDWWVDPTRVDMALAETFRSVGKDWKEMVKL